jgi:uroporphyrinogen-III synthase
MDANHRPGQRLVVVTAPTGAYPGLEVRLAEFDVTLRRRPLLEVEVVSDLSGLPHTLRGLTSRHGVVVTGPRSAALLAAHWPSGDATGGPTIWCSGEQTATALGGVTAARRVISGDHYDPATATALVTEIVGAWPSGPVLVLMGEPDLPDIASRLVDAGIEVQAVPLFQSQPVSDVELIATLERAEVLVVSNAAVVRALAAQGDDAHLPAWLAVGRVAADACRAAKVPLVSVAEEPTTSSVSVALRSLLETRFLLQPRAEV